MQAVASVAVLASAIDATTLDHLIESLRASDSAFRWVSDGAASFRASPLVDMLGFGLFAFAARNDVPRLDLLYKTMFSERPLRAWREGGIRDVHIDKARRAIFFYLLFLLYQLVQFVFTIGPSAAHERIVDFAIQLTLLGSILGDYASVHHALRERFKNDSDKQARVQEWLSVCPRTC